MGFRRSGKNRQVSKFVFESTLCDPDIEPIDLATIITRAEEENRRLVKGLPIEASTYDIYDQSSHLNSHCDLTLDSDPVGCAGTPGSSSHQSEIRSEAKPAASNRNPRGGIETPHGFVQNVQLLREYGSWKNMRYRCYYGRCAAFRYYGGRGIKVCDQWRHDFHQFYRDMGPKPEANYSIERIDKDGDYTPINCKWASQSEQLRNRRSWKWTDESRAMMCATQKAIKIQQEQANPMVTSIRGQKISWKKVLDAIAGGETQKSIANRLGVTPACISINAKLFRSKWQNAGEFKQWEQEKAHSKLAFDGDNTGIGYALSRCYGYSEMENHAHFEVMLSSLSDRERDLVLDLMDENKTGDQNDPEIIAIQKKLASLVQPSR